jgi:hypothetical protein
MRSLLMRILGGAALALLIFIGSASAQPKSSRNVYDLLSLLYGIPNAPLCNVAYSTVGTSPVRVLRNDPRAVSTFSMNLSSGVCSLGYNGQVTTSLGVQLGASGGFASEDYRTDMVLQTYEHWFVCTNASESILTIQCDLQ